jgi:tetratricopeptide (TPR) repeat protein
LSTHQSENLGVSIAAGVLAVIVILAPGVLQAQCQPLPSTAQSQAVGTPNSSMERPEFFDQPAFTVAGVTDTTNLGGHASGVSRPATENLAKRVVSLGKESHAGSQPLSSANATEKFLFDAVERDHDNFEANQRLGKILLDDGKAREGIAYLERAHQLNPNDYENTYELALANADVGNYERARSNLRLLLTQDKAQQDKRGRETAEMHHLLGEMEEKLSNPLEAAREYQRAAELDPSEPNLFDWGAELLLHRAPEPAIQVFTKGNRLFPTSGRMLVGLGVAWYVRGAYEQAATQFCHGSDLNPSDPTPYLFLGKTLSLESTHSEGVKQRLGRFVQLQPENAQANYYYALSLWKSRYGPEDSGKLAQIESLLDKAVHLEPKLGAGYLQLGLLSAERNDLPKEISAYEKAIAATPQLAEAHYRLAQAYRRIGEPAKAEQELQLFRQVSKESAEENERERREIQQFVYTLQSRPSAPQLQ